MAKAKKPKKPPIPRTRCGGTMTEAMFFTFIRGWLRRMSKSWPPIRQAKIEARVPYVGKNKRRTWMYRCAACGKYFPDKETQVDHAEPAGTLKTFNDLPAFVERLLCEKEFLRVLCIPCHDSRRGEANASEDRGA